MTLIFRIWLRYIKPLNKFIKILLLLSLKAYFHYLRSFFSYSIMLIARSFQKAFISAVFVLLHSRGWIWICSQHTASVASSPSKIGLKLLCYCHFATEIVLYWLKDHVVLEDQIRLQTRIRCKTSGDVELLLLFFLFFICMTLTTV